MEKPRLKLRGHHIGTFAVEYWGNKFYRPSLENYTNTRGSIILKKEKEFGEKKNLFGREGLTNQPQDTLTLLYGQRMKRIVDTVYALLKSQPDMEVEIVEGLDSICETGCTRLSPDCAKVQPDDEDALALKTYELEVGRVYTAREIVQRVYDFTMRTGIRSPRDIRLAQRGQVATLLS